MIYGNEQTKMHKIVPKSGSQNRFATILWLTKILFQKEKTFLFHTPFRTDTMQLTMLIPQTFRIETEHSRK